MQIKNFIWFTLQQGKKCPTSMPLSYVADNSIEPRHTEGSFT
jgi:hypothetical protein